MTIAVAPLLYGALPHATVGEAMAMLQRFPMPYMVWPQLPQRSFRERSVVQAAWGFPGVVVDERQRRVFVQRAKSEAALPQLALDFLQRRDIRAALTPAEAAGLFAMLPWLGNQPTEVGCKGQLLGPISLAAQLTDEDQIPLIADAMLFEGLVQHLCQRARWQAELLGRANRPVLMCLDEPFLDVLTSPFLSIDRDELWFALARVLDALPCQRAVAIGGDVALAPVLALPIDMVIVNSWDYAARIIEAAPQLHAFLQRGGKLGLGCVPLQGGDDVLLLAQAKVLALIDQCGQAGITAPELIGRLFVMPVSSLGQIDSTVVATVVTTTCQLATRVSHQLQNLVGAKE
ncbi:MAG: hypothetical protein EBS29_01425 [Chloroflexia bacterium]|nr:hypothetical protein [Chloroflexia bacterium]